MGNVIMKAQQITYGASNVEKALDDLKAPELIELNKRMAAIDAWKANVHEVTYTGSELTIDNALKLPARSLKTTIEAIQDLHGYDHPWAGGAGKNKAELSTGNNTVIAHDLPAGTYTFSCKNTGNCGINLKANTQEGDTLAYTPSATTGDITLTFTTAETMDIFVNGYGSGYDSAVSQYQIESGSSATFFAPYSNVCPISGRTEARVDTENEDSSESAYAVIQLGTTVYGADINWDTGMMTVKNKYKDITKNDISNNGTTGGLIEAYVNGTSDKANGPTNMLCNPLTVGSTAAAYVIRGRATSANVTFCLPTDVASDFEAVKTWVDNNPIQLVYALATPTTIQLTPTQLQMLKGYNRVTVPSGYATIELKALVLGGDN